MKRDRHRISGLIQVVTAVVLISFVSMVSGPPAIAARPGDETIYERFEEVSSLRSQGRYDQAIDILRSIITEPSQSEEILRRAYSDLVFTLLSKDDITGATKTATEALYRFPDLTADPVYFPPRVNDVYDGLRGSMFGTLNIATRPESCQVFLDGQFVGRSPLMLGYVKVGEYDLSVTRAGYHDESTRVRIEPGRPTSVPLSLQKERGRSWWLTRVGPVAILASVLFAIQLQKDEPGEAKRLPGPPPPP